MLAYDSALAAAHRFLGRHWKHAIYISAGLLLPCFWQRHIQAGDLGSHLYNAWLAQLIDKGEAPGLYLARQFSNVLFDFFLSHLANVLGFWLAEKIAVSACVLIFFWGVFALISAVADDAQWILMPCVATLAYGYAFNMGFMNYYLSLGFGAFALALVWPVTTWSRKEVDWIVAALFLVLAWLAHPIGCLWGITTIAYVAARNRLNGAQKLAIPGASIAAL